MKKGVDFLKRCAIIWVFAAMRQAGGLAQLVRAPASHAGGHWFESSSLHQKHLSSALTASAQRKDLYKNSAGLQDANKRRNRAAGAESKQLKIGAVVVCDCLKGFSFCMAGGFAVANKLRACRTLIPRPLRRCICRIPFPWGRDITPNPATPLRLLSGLKPTASPQGTQLPARSLGAASWMERLHVLAELTPRNPTCDTLPVLPP